MELAKLASSWSKDPSTKVGCCIADDKNRIISVAYNGFPRGIIDSEEYYADRELKYQRTIHAEMNAILFAKQDLEDCTIYVYPMPSCASCTSAIIQSGIQTVFTCEPTEEQKERWKDSFDISRQMFEEAGVAVFEVSREELL